MASGHVLSRIWAKSVSVGSSGETNGRLGRMDGPGGRLDVLFRRIKRFIVQYQQVNRQQVQQRSEKAARTDAFVRRRSSYDLRGSRR